MEIPGSSNPTVSSGLRSFIYLTAAVNGAAIMVVEILGAKLLAPFLGTSHFVWTAQIGVAMASLAVGYYAGGRWADSAARIGRLYAAMLAASAYLCLVLFGVRPVAERCVDLPLALGALLASMFLFFIPLALLAMTTPFLVRFITGRLDGLAGNVGRLSAVSTVGSLGGTALIGYVLLPLAPNSVTLAGTAAVVALLALVYLAVWGGSGKGAAVATAAILALGAGAVRSDMRPPFGQLKQVHRSNSDFGQLQVCDTTNGLIRFFLNDYLIQNTYDTRTQQSVSVFTYALHDLAVAYGGAPRSVLCIGLGVGIVPGRFAADGAKVDVVEINPAVPPLAEKFFGFDGSRCRVTIADGRQFLNRLPGRYDAVVLDAFLGDSSPSHLMTAEAFTAMREVLEPEGVLVINSFGHLQRGKDFLVASLQKTLRSVFTEVRLHDVGNGNMFFVASRAPLRIRATPTDAHVHPGVASEWHGLFSGVVEADAASGRVLTDDFNPVDFFDAANRERGRREITRGMREL
jgi:spermidine synthase